MNRRDFLVSGSGAALALGAGAWIATGPRTGTGAARRPGALPLAAVFDSRFASSLEFGQGAARSGCEPLPIRGDVTDLWVRRLRPQWARGEGAIVGMTTAVSFLCLRQLASEFWMPVVARVEHIAQADARVRHRMHVHDDFLPAMRVALADEAGWPASLVAPLLRTLGTPSRGPLDCEHALTGRSPALQPEMPLVSWAIATRAARRGPVALDPPLHLKEIAS